VLPTAEIRLFVSVAYSRGRGVSAAMTKMMMGFATFQTGRLYGIILYIVCIHAMQLGIGL